MSGIYLEDWKPGPMEDSRGRTLTETDVVMFAGLTGIAGPPFMDEEFAQAGRFGRRVVQGPLVLSYAIGLSEWMVDGTAVAVMGLDEVRFSAPVFFGETIRVKTHVDEVRESSKPGLGVVTIAHSVVKNGDAAVASFRRTMLIGSREHWAASPS